MTSNDNFSLRETLKKRKLQRSVSMVNTPPTKTTPLTSPLSNPIPPTRATQTAKIASASTQQATSEHGFRQTVEELFDAAKEFTQRHPRITLLVIVGCIVIYLSVLAFVSSSPRAQPPTLVALPLVNTDDVINHLRSVGLPLGNAEPYADGSKWSAAQSVRFDVPDKGYVVMLSYADQAQTNDNAFKLQFAPEYAEWRQISLTNIIVLASPEVSEALYHDITSNLIRYLVVPYRPEMLRN